MFTTGHNFEGAPCLTPENAPKFLSVIEHAGAIKEAACKNVCSDCDHRASCLDLGTFEGNVLAGVYGGLSRKEREELEYGTQEDYVLAD